jgi:hypothetical protein
MLSGDYAAKKKEREAKKIRDMLDRERRLQEEEEQEAGAIKVGQGRAGLTSRKQWG